MLLINFNITQTTLDERLLSLVNEAENPSIETNRQMLRTETNASRLTVEQLETNLLHKISTANEIILDSPELILLFESTKEKICILSEKIQTATITFNQIESVRNRYVPIAQKGTQLYFILCGLAAINHLYQFSFESFLRVFTRALQYQVVDDRQRVQLHTQRTTDDEGNGNDDDDDGTVDDIDDGITTDRIKLIIQRLCTLLYALGCMSIFDKDKLLLAFQITIKMALCDGSVTQNQIDFFIRGSEYGSTVIRSCPFEWLSETNWKCIVNLELNFGEWFSGLTEHIVLNESDWMAWIKLQYPDVNGFPNNYGAELSPFAVNVLV